MNDIRIAPLLALAHGGPVCEALFKSVPEDFLVSEILPFEADGEGPHWLVHVEKTDINTLNLLDEMAAALSIRRNLVGYSGLKDRYAVTRQWVSVPAQNLTQDAVRACRGRHWKVLDCLAHRRKVRVGCHKLNQFDIHLREIPKDLTVRETLGNRLTRIAEQGVPNYFGPQRFGQNGANLRKATQLLVDAQKLPRQQHRFAVSAARSMMFNASLSARVDDQCWDQFVEGELVMLDGSNSWFELVRLGEDGEARRTGHDIHPSGPMWGDGLPKTTGRALHFETQMAARFGGYAKGLAALGLKQERRALRLSVRHLRWTFDDDSLRLTFALSRGGFATSVLRELVRHPQLEFLVPETIRVQLAQSPSRT